LLAANGHYARLHAMQFQDDAALANEKTPESPEE